MTPSFKLATAVLVAASALPAFAQKLSSGPSSTVVYVGGDDLVVKSADGKLLNYTVPTGTRFMAGGKSASLSELKPGTKLTAPVATPADPEIVSEVAVVKGKVYAVTPPDGVTLLLTEGVKELVVPKGTTFMVDGKSLKVSEIKPDMMVQVTIVTTGDATATSAATAPAMSGTLLVAKTASAEDMPSAGTNLPLYGMTGVVVLLFGIALLAFNRKPLTQI